MRRLSDERVTEIQDQEGVGRIDNPDYQGGEDLDSLFRDHLQAREDRKRLVEMVHRLRGEGEFIDETLDEIQDLLTAVES